MNTGERYRPEESPIDAQMAAPPASYRGSHVSTSNPQEKSPEGSEATPFSDLFQSRGAVIAILFLATGALGIPLLWTNRKFSNGERIFWTIAVTIYTILLLVAFCWVMLWSYRRIQGM